MSKFQSTISVVAALASIFGAGAAGWKLSQNSVQSTEQVKQTQHEGEIELLREEIRGLKEAKAAGLVPTPAPAPAPAPLPLPEAIPPAPPAPELPHNDQL